MVVLRGHVILEGFGFRGSRAMKLRPSRHGLNARSRALRDAARSSARQYAAQAARVARAREVERLGGCSGIESVAEVGERHVACVRRGEPRGEPSTRRVASTRRPILDERDESELATKVSRDSRGTIKRSSRSLSLDRNGRDSIRWKASWIAGAVAPNPCGREGGSGAAETSKQARRKTGMQRQRTREWGSCGSTVGRQRASEVRSTGDVSPAERREERCSRRFTRERGSSCAQRASCRSHAAKNRGARRWDRLRERRDPAKGSVSR